MTTKVAAPAWYPDPLARHEYRYWDGATWTAHVSDLGVTALDELVPDREAQIRQRLQEIFSELTTLRNQVREPAIRGANADRIAVRCFDLEAEQQALEAERAQLHDGTQTSEAPLSGERPATEQGQASAQLEGTIAEPAGTGSGCPRCGSAVHETKGSPVSPSINVFKCPSCGWVGLGCPNTSANCNGYLEHEEVGYPNSVRYHCLKCGWAGMGDRF